MKEPKPFDQLDAAQREALRHFSQANGRHWRQTLLRLWDTGADDAHPLLRQIRNNIGPSGLLAITAEQLHTAESAAEKEIRRADTHVASAQEALKRAQRELADAEQEQAQAADHWRKVKSDARA
jgi:uncharacterized protein (DUF3084 family)